MKPKHRVIKTLSSSRQTALYAAKLALDKKGFNLIILDTRPWHALMDFIFIVSAQSTKHAQTIAKHIQETFRKENIHPIGVEGLKEGKWVLLDYHDLIIHVFFEYVRDFYDIEALWHDAPKLSIPKTYYKRNA